VNESNKVLLTCNQELEAQLVEERQQNTVNCILQFKLSYGREILLTNFSLPIAPAFMEHLMALGVEPGDQDLAARSLAALKAKLAEEKGAQEKISRSQWIDLQPRSLT
jgi:hypothetical protein